MQEITSVNNNLVKETVKLQQKKYRDKENKFLLEGKKCVEEAFQAGEEGQVTVEFTIDVNGYVSDAKVTKSVSASLDKEALRIIESMPRWKPGMQLGRPVAVCMSVPINFVIEQDYQVTD